MSYKKNELIKFLKFTADTQLHAIPLGPVTGHHREEIRALPFSAPHEEAADCNEVTP